MAFSLDIPSLQLPREQIADYCRRWKITELSVFGSVLREDFGPTSDLDVLVSFSADADWSLLDHARMQQELSALVGREVDLVSRRAVEHSANWLRRDAILQSLQPIYVSG